MGTRHFEDLGKLYDNDIAPITETQEKVRADQDEQDKTEFTKQIDSKYTLNYICEGQDKQNLPHADDTIETGKAFDEAGPHAADGFQEAEIDTKKDKAESVHEEDKFSNNVEQNEEKLVKKEQKEINTSTMRQNSNKSSFDKLFEDVMGDDVPMDLEMGGDLDLGNDELGDEGDMDYVTIELDRDLAEKLHKVLMGVLDSDDVDDVDDIEDIAELEGEDLSEEDVRPESHVELEVGPSDAVSKLASMNNKVGGDANPAGGSADTSTGGQEDGGKPKAHNVIHNHSGTSDNKVNGKVKGGNQPLFKA